jgi:cell division septal protein FtsQ
MKKKSASTLIYFQEKARKRNLTRRPVRVNKEKRAKHFLIAFRVIIIIAAAGSLLWYYIKFQPLNIRSIEISGAERFVNREDLNNIAEEKALNQNIVSFNSRNLKEAVTANFLASKSVEVVKHFPSKLQITITERTPIALILPLNRNNGYYFVDSDGFILGRANKSDTNLPVINYSQDVEVGKFVEASAVKYFFDLIQALDEDKVAVSTISSYPRYTEFFTKEATQVLFTNDQSPKPQVRIFSKMMEAFKTEGKKLKKIDLRFDKVIVEFIN